MHKLGWWLAVYGEQRAVSHVLVLSFFEFAASTTLEVNDLPMPV